MNKRPSFDRVFLAKWLRVNSRTDEGDSVELRADIVTIGVSGVSEDDVHWQVDLLDENGEVAVLDLVTGTGFEVSAAWDGRIDGLAVDNPTSYEFRITATLCGGSGVSPRQALVLSQGLPEGQCLLAQVKVATRQPAVLLVKKASQDVAFGFVEGTSGANRTLVVRRSKLTRKIHTVNNGDELSITLRPSFGPEATKPPIITAKVISPVSGIEMEVDLEQGETDENYYEGKVTLPSNFIQRSPPNQTGSDTIHTRYNLGTIFGQEGDSAAFEAHVMSPEQATAAAYPPKRARLGIFRERLVNPLEEPKSVDEVASSISFLEHLGFETLKVKVLEPSLSIEASINVRNPAEVVAWSFHGLPDGKLLPNLAAGESLNDENISKTLFEPDLNLSEETTGNLKTLILSACSALHLRNYNQVKMSSPGTLGAMKWHNATGQGRTVLLGYQQVASSYAVPGVYEEFGRELARLTGSESDPRQLQILAWMSANLKLGKQSGGIEGINRLALGACAMDANWYYYIPAKYPAPEGEGKLDPLPDASSAEKVYRVPKSLWSKEPHPDWKVNRSIAEEVMIP